MIKRSDPDSFKKENWCLNRSPKIDKTPMKNGHLIGGPYVMKKAFLEGALILAEMDGKKFSSPINADIVKKHYA